MNGCPVGTASYRLFLESDKGFGFVAADVPELSIAVLEQARGQGVGSRLMERLIEQGRADGFRGLSLSVDPRNPAVRLYERLGFKYLTTDEGGSWTMFKPID
jgi:GNAT superfamily N-acetyltransferase